MCFKTSFNLKNKKKKTVLEHYSILDSDSDDTIDEFDIENKLKSTPIMPPNHHSLFPKIDVSDVSVPNSQTLVNREIIRQQDKDFENSLIIDREKQHKKNEEEEKLKENEEKREQLKNLMLMRRILTPEEPDLLQEATCTGTVIIIIITVICSVLLAI